MSGYRFRQMEDEEATQISGWHYESTYDFYNATSDQEDLQEILDPNVGRILTSRSSTKVESSSASSSSRGMTGPWMSGSV
jgi:hypothetical protein